MEKNPKFDFTVPSGYSWILEHKWIGFEPFTGMQPWHYLDSGTVFDIQKRWPGGPLKGKAIAFAKRQDNDDLACFEIQNDEVVSVVTIHGWTSSGYSIIKHYDTFWDWLKSVLEDIAKWCECTT